MNTVVCFHEESGVEDELLKFAVIAARHNGRWIFCRHTERSTYEIPGGHREAGEDIVKTAERELYEETGALEFDLSPVCVYSVAKNGQTTYGKLFYANVKKLGALPSDMEMGECMLADELPEKLTYPAIQPFLFFKAVEAEKEAAQNVAASR